MIYIEQKERYETKRNFQGLEALDPSLGFLFPSQGLTLARQCIILSSSCTYRIKTLSRTLRHHFKLIYFY